MIAGLIVRRPLATGAVVGAVIALPVLLGLAWPQLDRLAAARARHDAAAAVLARPAGSPAPLVAAGQGLGGATPTEAARRLEGRISALGRDAGLLVEAMAPARRDDRLIALNLVASGRESAVIGLIGAVERGAPLMRFARLRLDALGNGDVRMTGEVVAAMQ